MIEEASILIVDDDERIRDALQRALSRAQYSCRTARDAHHAADLLEKEEIDLVLLDINMPGSSGLEFLPRITTRYPDIAVVMLTGVDERSTAVWAMREGACDFAAKPVDMGELVIKIENALRRLEVVRENNAYHRNLETMGDELGRLRVQNRGLEALAQTIQSRISSDLEDDFGQLKTAIKSTSADLERLAGYANFVATPPRR